MIYLIYLGMCFNVSICDQCSLKFFFLTEDLNLYHQPIIWLFNILQIDCKCHLQILQCKIRLHCFPLHLTDRWVKLENQQSWYFINLSYSLFHRFYKLKSFTNFFLFSFLNQLTYSINPFLFSTFHYS